MPPRLRFEPPVPVGGEEQPVLQIGTLQDEEITKLTALHHAARLLRQRIHADVEVDRVDKFLLRCQLHQLPRLCGGHRQRLFADHMFAGQQGSLGMRIMQMIGRGKMHHVNIRVSQHFIERAIAARDAKFRSFLLGLLRCFSASPSTVMPLRRRAFDMRRTNETRPCHANADGLFCELFGHEYMSLRVTNMSD